VSLQFDASFGKAKRLVDARDYSRVFDRPDAKAFHNNLLLLARRNNGPGHRLGLVIAKKNVRQAVQRNRIKRIAREFVRQTSGGVALDVVVLARRGLDQMDNTELASLFRRQWLKLARNVDKLESNKTQGSQCAEF
jgi:ribonuclease P protein component